MCFGRTTHIEIISVALFPNHKIIEKILDDGKAYMNGCNKNLTLRLR